MMYFSTSDENFQKTASIRYVVKQKLLNSIPLEFLKSILSPQTRFLKTDDL